MGWRGGHLLNDSAASPGLRGTCPEGGGWEQAAAVLHLCVSLSCVTGDNRTCQKQAVSWLNLCWATVSVLSWKLLKHTMIIHVKLPGCASMLQCRINTVLMQQYCYLGCSLSH